MDKIWIGTSGFTYEHWREIFYPRDLPQAKWLEFYSQHFSTVEINASFYHQMSRKIYEGWAKRTPDNFIFTVKGSRFITHIKRLKDCREPVERFLESVSGLGEKLGVILWQLPPRWVFDKLRLEEFLKLISPKEVRPPRRSDLTRNIRHAFEFRDSSWLNEQVYTLLKKHNCALVIQDSPSWPTAEVITADFTPHHFYQNGAGFTYLRFHGNQSLYGSCYNKEELREWAEKIKKWQKNGLDVYAYFNNDAQGYAVRNAKELKELVSSEL